MGFLFLVDILHPDGSEAAPNELGRVAIKLPLPPGNMSTLYKNDELFDRIYFKKFPVKNSSLLLEPHHSIARLMKMFAFNLQGYYDTMDAGYKDENGYVYITARDDDIINVAGHRISTMALEDAVLRHPDVADAAVFGVPEPTKGEVPCCLYIIRDETAKLSTKISVELIKIIREVIGPIASFRLVAPVNALPRTRSGKTLRKAMAEFARNKRVILPATVEDPAVFQDIRRALQELGYAQTAPEPQILRK